MNSKNTKLTILSVLLILVISLAALTGCDGGSGSGSISEIFVVNTDVPRTTYVVGQSLDLTGGKLSVVIDGQKSYVPMTNEGVSVTGYDPNTLGKQTLTLTYQGHTATFDVTVVQRAVAENVETNYFKGDSLDTSKGRLRITRDDGTSFTVNLKDSKVSVKSFPNGSTGKATAVVTYSGELVCDCSFEVTFHEIGRAHV